VCSFQKRQGEDTIEKQGKTAKKKKHAGVELFLFIFEAVEKRHQNQPVYSWVDIKRVPSWHYTRGGNAAIRQDSTKATKVGL